MQRQGAVVRAAARRSEVLIAPCTAMAERIARVMPDIGGRIVVRMHPVSAAPVCGRQTAGTLILCPVLFAPYKQMTGRLAEWLAAVDLASTPASG